MDLSDGNPHRCEIYRYAYISIDKHIAYVSHKYMFVIVFFCIHIINDIDNVYTSVHSVIFLQYL